MKKGTLAVSWGAYGGFYLSRHRICLGWVAITLIPAVEIEDLMQAYVDAAGRDLHDHRLDVLEIDTDQAGWPG